MKHCLSYCLAGLVLLANTAPKLDAQEEVLPPVVAAGASLEQLAVDLGFTEGPALAEDGTLFFTDLRPGHIYQLAPGEQAPTIFRTSRDNLANGLAFDGQGRLHACEGGSGRVTRTELDGTVVVLADQFEGQRFNSPNDPGHHRRRQPLLPPTLSLAAPAPNPNPLTGVYRIAPTGNVSLVTGAFNRPNGIAISPDGATLYVTNDSPERVGQIWAFGLQADGTAANQRLFANAASIMDGMSVDADGNLYAASFPQSGASGRGIWVFASSGAHLGTIPTPENPTNCILADQTLYITASSAVHAIQLNVNGLNRFQTSVEPAPWGRIKATPKR